MKTKGIGVFRDTKSNATVAYVIFCVVFVMVFALMFKDAMFLVFGFPIVLLFALGSSFDGGTTEQDLETVGWSSGNMKNAVPIGIVGGLSGLMIGGLITNFVPGQMASLVPDLAGTSSILTASVIPASLSISANIFSQFMVIAPSEEALSRVLIPYASYKAFKNWIIAFVVIAPAIWIGSHIPTFIAQGAPQSMYLVLFVLAMITTAGFLLTKTILTAIISHGVFNSGVIIINGGIDITAYFIVFLIIAVLAYAWFKGDAKPLKLSIGR